MEEWGKWRYTSPTHVVLAFRKALEELLEEGGIPARQARYENNNRILVSGMKEMGFAPYIGEEMQSPIITTFFYPENITVDFNHFYHYIKDRGYAIYPGKLTEGETFRVGNIGEIYSEDMETLLSIIKAYLKEMK